MRAGRKRGPPAVAIAVRAMENFAILGVDSICIAHGERPAGANGNSLGVAPAFFQRDPN